VRSTSPAVVAAMPYAQGALWSVSLASLKRPSGVGTTDMFAHARPRRKGPIGLELVSEGLAKPTQGLSFPTAVFTKG